MISGPLLSPPKCWYDSHVPPCVVYAVLGTDKAIDLGRSLTGKSEGQRGYPRFTTGGFQALSSRQTTTHTPLGTPNLHLSFSIHH